MTGQPHSSSGHSHSHDLEVKKVDRLSGTEVRLSLAFPAQTLMDHEQMMARQYAREAALPGFRPGKAPVKMVLERFRDKIRRDVVSHLMEAGFVEALEKTQMDPVGRPRMELGRVDFDGQQPMEFSAQFEVMPDVSVRDYKGIALKQESVVVTDDEVTKTLDTVRERLATLEPSDATEPTTGSIAVLEVGYRLESEEGGEPASSFTVEVGNGKLINEIDAAVMQMKVGETRDVEGTFPDDYQEEKLRGKKATFKVSLLEIKKKQLPELDDTLAETVRPGLNLDQLKEDIRKSIKENKAELVRRSQRQQILDHLSEKNRFDVPRAMVENQCRRMLTSMAEDFKDQGRALPPLNDEQMKELWGAAERVVRTGLILRAIAKQEKLELADTDVEKGVEVLAAGMSQSVDETRQQLEAGGTLDSLADRILTNQIFDFLIEHAKR